ncbi:ead/Ea22-like family protein [Salmonella enterica]|nr:ead/Ea22-like family protein [Salmonella enterica]
MTALNKQALREAAQEEIMLRSVSDTSDAWQDEASPEAVLALLDELEAVKKISAARLEAIDRTHKMFQREKDRADASEKRIAEHRKVLNNLAAVARRYLPDYDEHPEIQAADELLESAAGIGVRGE